MSTSRLRTKEFGSLGARSLVTTLQTILQTRVETTVCIEEAPQNHLKTTHIRDQTLVSMTSENPIEPMSKSFAKAQVNNREKRDLPSLKSLRSRGRPKTPVRKRQLHRRKHLRKSLREGSVECRTSIR